MYSNIVKICIDAAVSGIVKGVSSEPYILIAAASAPMADDVVHSIVQGIIGVPEVVLSEYRYNRLVLTNTRGLKTTIQIVPIVSSFKGLRGNQGQRPTTFISVGFDVEEYKEKIYSGILPALHPITNAVYSF